MNRQMARLRVAVLSLSFTFAAAPVAAIPVTECAWGPITDVPRAQALLRNWAGSNQLPPFDAEKSGLSIDGVRVHVALFSAPQTEN